MNENITHDENTNDETDPRQQAARRLAMVGMLQMHQLRRAMRPWRGAPWQDPSQGQGRVLAILKLQPEITQRELTFLMGMSRQSLAELLAKLEKQGLVEREPSADDRRVVVVRLTEAGKAAEQAAEHNPSPSDDLLDALEDDEVGQLSGFLARILEQAERECSEEAGERGEEFEAWRSRGGFGSGPRGFGRGGFPGFGPWFGGPGPRGPWGPHERGPHHHGGPRGPHNGPRNGRDGEAQEV
ncbi:MarR family winged helix-turn-helix transcriptional regulator [Xylanimonas sp. McL0601]|uniref:MarR family winged helix-turn-helix transcriptional regulator n=1 Tax=Xylanimonas sp. McL0601 TaxID=3414739 RepID=UPI003CEA6D9A